MADFCPLPDRRYSVIYADPPWAYGQGGKGKSSHGIAKQHYPNDALPRIMVACDEVGELTDTTGLDKPNKELVTAIVGHLSTLARLGRAFGIHLVLSTQRPDANVLPGQIKNNLDIRICGRSDLVLSQIILNNGDAAALPKEIPGRFLCNLDGGTIFQGYSMEKEDSLS